MSEYTPTTNDVRFSAVMAGLGIESHQFDRWLEQHDREVAAKAWDETVEQMYMDVTISRETGQMYVKHNPYR